MLVAFFSPSLVLRKVILAKIKFTLNRLALLPFDKSEVALFSFILQPLLIKKIHKLSKGVTRLGEDLAFRKVAKLITWRKSQ